MIGSTIAHYRIIEKLGEGGMGVVYQAEDTKLRRRVALKFLAPHLLDDAEAKERFLREAQAAAALHHANICPVYEIDEADGQTFISMAYVEGETLEDRIASGPLPIREALEIGRQVAKGLQAAHERGIVHRDIKPPNILVAKDGQVTIMDFGLARLAEASRLTKAETAMGTVAYMSPEQAQGMEVDHRTDVWSLGCVLYEMVSGQRPFQGRYDQALLYEVVHEEPAPLTSLRAGVPMELEFIVGKCLAKDAEDRHQSAKEVAVDLRTLAEKLKSGRSTILRAAPLTGAAAPVAGSTVSAPVAPPPDLVTVPRSRYRLALGLLGVASLAAVVLAWLYFTRPAPATPERLVRRLSIVQDGIGPGWLSPDGRYVAYVLDDGSQRGERIWVRSLATETSRELEGTEGALSRLCWSPDSRWIVFAVGAPEFQLKKVSIDGGLPISLAELPGRSGSGPGSVNGGSAWSPDGERIVFSSDYRLFDIPAGGGEPQLLVDRENDDQNAAVEPLFLPAAGGPQAIVFSTGRGEQRLAMMNLETGERRELVRGDHAAFSPEGYLIHGSGRRAEFGLWATPFSRETLQVTGETWPINSTGALASVGGEGSMVYWEFSGRDAARSMSGLVWRDRSGQIQERVGQPQPGLREFELSPDGRRVATTVDEPPDIWIQDLERSTVSRFTFDPISEFFPRWSPNGAEIVYSMTGNPNRMLKKATDGSGAAEALFEPGFLAVNADWSPDGRYLIFEGRGGEETGQDLLYAELDESGRVGRPQVFLATLGVQSIPQFSPDGRFVAYVSDESKRREVYVRPFPAGAGVWQVSTNGGAQPRWRPDGKELFYVEDNRRLMAVPVTLGETPTLGRPEPLFESSDFYFRGQPSPMYDVSADGRRILTSTAEGEPDPPRIRVVLNWFEEFRDRAE